MPHFRLVQCDAAGAPVEPLVMPDALTQACAASAALYARIGFASPWVSYIAVADDACVGGCAFVGAPNEGRVEIAYFTLPPFEGRGYARASAAALVALARAAAPEVTVFAKTLPEHNSSTAILQRLRFTHVGETQDDDIGVVWLWELVPTSGGV